METLFIGLASGIVLGWFGHHLQVLRTRNERLLERYAELLGTVQSDIDRAKDYDRLFRSKPGRAEENWPAWKALWDAEEEKRENFRRELHRLGVFVRVVETDPHLQAAVAKLVKMQRRRIYTADGIGDDAGDELFESHLQDYEQALERLIQHVQERHMLLRFKVKGWLGRRDKNLPKAKAKERKKPPAAGP